MRGRHNVQFAIVTGVAGLICALVKMHSFSWGDVPILENKATINDVWYYWFEGFSYAFFTSALAFAGACVAANDKQSWSAFLIKYLAIATSFIFVNRALFNMFYFDKVTELEVLVDLVLITVVCHRAEEWYKNNLRKHHANNTPSRNPMEGN